SWPRDWSSDVCSSDLGFRPGARCAASAVRFGGAPMSGHLAATRAHGVHAPRLAVRRRACNVRVVSPLAAGGMTRKIPNAVPSLGGNEWRYLKECLDTNWVSSAGPFVERFE